MMPSKNTHLPIPAEEQQPLTRTELSPCFTVAARFIGFSSKFSCRHTPSLPSDPNKFNSLSSEKNSRLKYDWLVRRHDFAKSNRFDWLIWLIHGLDLGVQALYPLSYSPFRTVVILALQFSVFSSATILGPLNFGFFFICRTMKLWSTSLSKLGHQHLVWFLIVFLLQN